MRLNIVLILVLFCFSFKFDFIAGSILQHDEIQPLNAEERKLLAECENSDYRAYIKCLKRHKRHNHLQGDSKACLMECFETNCTVTGTKCADDCYNKCKKKFKVEESYSRTISADLDNCNNRNCNEENSAVHNINTNVHVNASLFGNEKNLTTILGELLRPKIEINNVINNDGNNENSHKKGSGSPYVPNIFTLSMSMAGYGSFPMMMPPIMTPMIASPVANLNCTLCGNLMFRFSCDISCVNQTLPASSNTDRLLENPSKCRSPNCVGGT